MENSGVNRCGSDSDKVAFLKNVHIGVKNSKSPAHAGEPGKKKHRSRRRTVFETVFRPQYIQIVWLYMSIPRKWGSFKRASDRVSRLEGPLVWISRLMWMLPESVRLASMA